MKKPKHNFNLESRANKSGEQLIFFNLNYGYKEYNVIKQKQQYVPLRISTQWTIDKKYWNDKPFYRANKTYVSKFGKDLNNILDKVEETAYTQLSIYRNEYSENPLPTLLKRIVLEKLGRLDKVSTDVIITKYIDTVVTKRKKLPPSSKLYWGVGTAKQYENLKAHIEFYQLKTKNILTFAKLDETEYYNLFNNINSRNIEIHGKAIKHNTIAKNCKHLRAILKIADGEGIEIGFDWSKNEYKINEVTTENSTTLEQDQLLTIYNTDTNHSKEFTNARNYILFSALTALRIGDMVELHNCEVQTFKVENSEFKGFRTKIRKTKGVTNELFVIVPLAEPLLQLLKENNNTFPKFPSKPVIGRQIKKFLKFLEFDNIVEFKEWYYPEPTPTIETHLQHEKFNPHSCRYTFITNMSKLGVPESVVRNITHPTAKARNILDGYTLTSMEYNAYNLLSYLKRQKSSIYKY